MPSSLISFFVCFYLHPIIAAGASLTRADSGAPPPSVPPGEGGARLRLQPAQQQDQGCTVCAFGGTKTKAHTHTHRSMSQYTV